MKRTLRDEVFTLLMDAGIPVKPKPMKPRVNVRVAMLEDEIRRSLVMAGLH